MPPSSPAGPSGLPELEPHPGYRLVLPDHPRPVVLVGAGGIVRDAHLPAYAKAGFTVASLTDLDLDRAHALAEAYGITETYGSVADAVAHAPADAVYDVALPPEAHVGVLEALPDGAAVLLQKPLGNDLADGVRTREVCRRKGLVAAVNTQLRFAPYVAAARELIAAGTVGELYDLEVRVSVNTPWEMFPYVLDLPRLEINMHSVHYLDLVRSFLGDPTGVSAVTVRHPTKTVANTRSDIALTYGDRPVRVVVSTNHDHHFGEPYEESFVKWEGTRGAVRAQLGLLLDYPRGGEDRLEVVTDDRLDQGWRPVPFEGSWFPDAFIGSMSVLQRYLEGSIPSLPTSVDDVFRTMAVVEAAYRSAASGGEPPPYDADRITVEEGAR
ncbi:Predicted dehydrogenase [Microlunatus sagamiharensis]|uniref:Predicted dehydrogenase n=1 Tax=Microlunatus sagamiharensis TaxID=546874 RepID=A0A1H2MFF3_9ACTN|nr:Gfo/Idh/MocA family oxidoreductase [Microlunatus sagamiharensis]SDU91641.1 Predicted dehydrogenase [Microlunatus sagamiharensis]